MNTKTKTISISVELSKMIEKFAPNENTRMDFLEKAVEEFIAKLERQQIENNSIELNKENVYELNNETKDVLSYQDEIDILNRMADEQGEEILENLEYQIDV